MACTIRSYRAVAAVAAIAAAVAIAHTTTTVIITVNRINGAIVDVVATRQGIVDKPIDDVAHSLLVLDEQRHLQVYRPQMRMSFVELHEIAASDTLAAGPSSFSFIPGDDAIR